MPLNIAKSYFELKRLRQKVRDAERECARTARELALWRPLPRDESLSHEVGPLMLVADASISKERPN